MARMSLTTQEIDELIASYISARSKLQFQINLINQTISGLKEQKQTAPLERKIRKQVVKVAELSETDALEVSEAPRRGRSKKVTAADDLTAVKEKKSRGRKPAKAGRKKRKVKSDGYRLSDWDDFIIRSIAESNRPLVNSEIFDACKARSEGEGMELSNIQIQGKIARSLHKLSNKRKTLRKLDIPGRGFAYGLGEWFFSKTGKLKKVYYKGLNLPTE
jgi:hypothetical protein